MSLAAELYPDLHPDLYSDLEHMVSDYDPIIRSLGEVLLQVEDDDYQGDINVVVRGADGRLGFVRVGFGSRSGCDALQACRTLERVEQLIAQIQTSVRWYDSVGALKEAVSGENSGSFYEQSDCWPDFVTAVLALPEVADVAGR